MVRVVGDDGNQLGVMAISDALRMAREMGQDLVEVAPNAKPPVCRVMDYGKYKYQQSKRDAMAKKRQHQTQVKEVKLRPKIERHDFETKMRNARKFLGERDKVKVTVMFRGREMSHPQLGYELLQAVIAELTDIGQVEQNPSAEGRTITMLLSPLPQGAKTSSKSAAEDE
ncbi:MAG: translation initiation factor IF-3 [Candidatus Eisenbacteria bacterium]|uniref:Translation initiation factor IF-3 n=1 Tax=Eiseniibacteriota bacterium TaxID=2212470 RepID=A0A956N9W8_UNCEI|nr:translation initiation factor IF-3 [Candidatus Eisenbacteria bacterium]MCB9462613.1 translation initiation factor IF-3 [Candidatus Eisenbacteria bacterium]